MSRFVLADGIFWSKESLVNTGAFGIGQKNSKDGTLRPVCILGLDVYAPSVPFGDLFTHPQPESSPHVFFGGEEWLKDSFEVLRSNPGTIIFDLQSDRISAGELYGDASIFSVPLMGTASMALEMMFDTNCCISPAKPVIGGQASRAS